MDFVSEAVFLVLGIVAGSMWQQWIFRPKLVLAGGGGGSGRGVRTTRLMIENKQGVLGFRFGDTMLGGRTLHQAGQIGPSFDRRTARNCRASLMDAKDPEGSVALSWGKYVDGRMITSTSVDLASGEHAHLNLFSRPDEPGSGYYVSRPELQDTAAPRFDGFRFTGSRDFMVVLYSDNSRPVRRRFRVVESSSGGYTIKGGNFNSRYFWAGTF